MANEEHLDWLRRGAKKWNAYRQETRLTRADLAGAHVSGARFTDCQIFGACLWQLKGEAGDTQRMRICQSLQEPPPADSPELLTDSLDSAQFMYLLLDNPHIAGAFDALGQRIVLILGRFADGNLDVLEHFQRYPWVLDIVHYRDVAHLLSLFDERVRDAGRDRAAQLRRGAAAGGSG